MGKCGLRTDKSVGIFKIILLGLLTPVCIFQFVSAVIWLYCRSDLTLTSVCMTAVTIAVCLGSVLVWLKAFGQAGIKESLRCPIVVAAGVYIATLPVIWQSAILFPGFNICFIGGMIAVDGLLLCITESKRFRMFRALIVLGGIIISVVPTVCSLSSEYQTAVTPEGYWVNQIVVPNRVDDYPKYSQEVQSMWPDGNAVYYERTSEFYDNLDSFADKNGAAATRSNLRSMIKVGISNHGRDIVKHYIKDAGLNAFNSVGLSIYMFLNGRTKFGYDYFEFWQYAPVLSMKYMHISTIACALFSLVGNICMAADAIKNKKCKKICGLYIPALVYMGAHTAVLTFVNVPGADYNIGLLSTAVWLILPIMYLIQKDN